MKVERFEDLIAWQKARELTKQVYNITRTGALSKDFGLCDQIRRASVSVMSNIAEGFERGTSSEFHQFIVVAKGSCAEVRSELYVALDADYITEAQFDDIHGRSLELSSIIGGLKASIKKRKDTH
jgi:four helix bundle protein